MRRPPEGQCPGRQPERRLCTGIWGHGPGLRSGEGLLAATLCRGWYYRRCPPSRQRIHCTMVTPEDTYSVHSLTLSGGAQSAPPPPCPFMPLQGCGWNAFLSRGVDQPRNIGCSGGGDGFGRVDVVGFQDGDVAPAEGVGLRAGKIFLIAGCWINKAWGASRGLHGGWERPAWIKGSKLLPSLTGSALRRESVLIFQ